MIDGIDVNGISGTGKVREFGFLWRVITVALK